MGVAFEMARAAIAQDWSDYANATLAKRIIELTKAGERNPDVLCEHALSIPVAAEYVKQQVRDWAGSSLKRVYAFICDRKSAQRARSRSSQR
jgi:hypothetical protein